MSEAHFIREVTAVYKRGKGLKVPAAICSSRDLAAFGRKVIPDGPQERFVAISLDVKNHPVGWSTQAIGSTGDCPVDVSALLRFVLLTGGNQLVCIHNHPSGEVAPSTDDLVLTDRVREAATLIGLRLLDHVIVAEDGYFSFLDSGLIEPA